MTTRSDDVLDNPFAIIWPKYPWREPHGRIEPEEGWYKILSRWLPNYLPFDEPDWRVLRAVLLVKPFGFTPQEIDDLSIADAIVYLWNGRKLVRKDAARGESDSQTPKPVFSTTTVLNTDSHDSYIAILGSKKPQQPAPATNKPKGTGKRGKSRYTDAAADKKIADAWSTGQHTTYEQLANALGKTTRDVKLAIDRHRKHGTHRPK